MDEPVLGLGQHDARHYFMLQDALILAANRRACLWLHQGPVVEGCEMKTGTVVHTGVTTRGLLAHELSIGSMGCVPREGPWAARFSEPTRGDGGFVAGGRQTTTTETTSIASTTAATTTTTTTRRFRWTASTGTARSQRGPHFRLSWRRCDISLSAQSIVIAARWKAQGPVPGWPWPWPCRTSADAC